MTGKHTFISVFTGLVRAVFAVEKVFCDVNACEFWADCISQESENSRFPAFFCDAATGNGQFEKNSILLSAKMDATVLGVFRTHQPTALIETTARAFGFFVDTETENFFGEHGRGANKIFVFQKTYMNAVFIEKGFFMK